MYKYDDYTSMFCSFFLVHYYVDTGLFGIEKKIELRVIMTANHRSSAGDLIECANNSRLLFSM